jgi:hypothetical protein
MLRVENREVIRSWLVANEGLPNGTPFSRDHFEQLLSSIKQQIRKLSDQELEVNVEAKARSDPEGSRRLLTWRWTRCVISLKDFGPWRTVGDALPLAACRDSAVEAARFISRFPELPPELTAPDAWS